jgi:acetyl esterase/lipase
MHPKIARKLSFICKLVVVTALAADAPPVVRLWPGEAPGSEGKTSPEKVRLTDEGEHVVSSVHQPSLTVYLPAGDKATGAAVVIIPGGGHRELWMDHEGYNIGRWLADHGIAGFVAKYRLAREEGSTYKVDVESLADAQRAIQLVRSRAAEWGVDPARVGVIGFSAGGELAALTGMRFLAPKTGAADPVEKHGSKPAFQALVYPGNTAAVFPTKDSPPAFLLCGYGDRKDVAEGIARVYLKFKEVDVPAELHVYTGAGHGFGVRARNVSPSSKWPERFREWLDDRGFLGKKQSG